MLIKKTKNRNKLSFKKNVNQILLVVLIIILFLFIKNDLIKIKILNKNLLFTPSGNFLNRESKVFIISPIKSGKIYYTLDGSLPTTQSLLYNKEIGIDLEKNTVINAAIFKNNKQLSSVVNKSYFVNFDSDLAIISISTEPNNLWSEETGIYVVGNDPTRANYAQRENDWKRSAYFSFFENQQEIFSRIVEFEISGGSSATFPQKSFNVYFSNQHSNNAVNYQIFPQSSTKIFNSIKLRNSGNDWYSTLIRDCLMQELLRDYTNLDIQSCRPAVLILNGEYWGIYNIRERYNKDYFVNKFQDFKLDSTNIVVSTSSNDFDKKGHPLIKIGNENDADSYLDLITFALNNDLSTPTNYQKISKIMDIDNFIDYNIAEMFYSNYDWPHGNYKFWRYRNHIVEDQISPIDGRWRWLIFDTDYGFALDGPDTINTEVKKDAISLNMFYKIDKEEYVFKNLFNNLEFRKKFLTRYFDLLNTAFTEERIINKIDELTSQIDDEIDRHTSRWGDQTEGMLTNYQDWQKNIELLKNFAENRPKYVIKHLIEYFNFADIYQLKLSTSGPCQASIKVNSLTIKNNALPWTANYPQNYELNIELIPESNCHFVSWSSNNLDKKLSENKILQIKPNKDLELTAILTSSKN